MSSEHKRKLFLVLAGVFASLGIIVAGFAGVIYSYSGKIAPGTYLAGQSIGGKTVEQASQILSNQAAQLNSAEITLANSNSTSATNLEELGIEILISPTVEQIEPVGSVWSNMMPQNLYKLFVKKEVAVLYEVDQTKLATVITEKLGGKTPPQNAEIAVENGELVVKTSKPGEEYNTADAISTIDTIIQTGKIATVPVTHQPVEPQITEEMATVTKQAVVESIQPVVITGQNKSFTITKSELYPTIQYQLNGSILTWSVGESALKDLLNKKVGAKVNVAMVPRSIKSDTQEVVNAGREGIVLDTDALVTKTKAAIENAAAAKTVEFSTKTVAITEKLVHPEYQLGLYEGRYLNVNLSKQKMFLVEGSTLVAEYRVSTGKWSTPTPKGTMYIKNKISMAYSNPFRLWMPYWSGLSDNQDGSGYRGYGIHGLPCFNSDCTLVEGESHIGTAVSHGCIRVPTDVVAYVYDWAPVGTPVVIF